MFLVIRITHDFSHSDAFWKWINAGSNAGFTAGLGLGPVKFDASAGLGTEKKVEELDAVDSALNQIESVEDGWYKVLETEIEENEVSEDSSDAVYGDWEVSDERSIDEGVWRTVETPVRNVQTDFVSLSGEVQAGPVRLKGGLGALPF